MNDKNDVPEKNLRASQLAHISTIADLKKRGQITTEQAHTLINSFAQVCGLFYQQRQTSYMEGFREGDKDPLTGLPRRGTFAINYNTFLGQEKRGAKTNESDGGVYALVFDIASLKDTNDCLGQADGDSMIQAFADMLRSVFHRSNDIFRFGGDEFLVLLYNPSKEYLENVIPDLLKEALNEKGYFESKEIGKVPFGYRYATIPLEHMTLEEATSLIDPKLQPSRLDFIVPPGRYGVLNPAY